jgi:hypothetical protein
MAFEGPRPITRSKFTPEENELLRVLVDRLGVNAWVEVAAGIPGRNARQCRDRWKHYLSRKSDSPWTPEEDQILLQHVGKFGLKWTRLSAFFPNRTDFDVRARWLSLFRDKPRLFRSLSPPRASRRERRPETENAPPRRPLLPGLLSSENLMDLLAPLLESPSSLTDPVHQFPRFAVEPIYDPYIPRGMREGHEIRFPGK